MAFPNWKKTGKKSNPRGSQTLFPGVSWVHEKLSKCFPALNLPQEVSPLLSLNYLEDSVVKFHYHV